tara:strand:+ start:29009 stop:29209 length:201 start_codon:yes stop_codon:yes gene_type:complete
MLYNKKEQGKSKRSYSHLHLMNFVNNERQGNSTRSYAHLHISNFIDEVRKEKNRIKSVFNRKQKIA